MARGEFGSVRRLPSGRWQARYRTPDGRRLTAPQTFTTKSDGTRWLAVVRTQMLSGPHWDPHGANVRLADFAWNWLEHRTGLAPRTREIYANQLRKHVLPSSSSGGPVLGDCRLADLEPGLIRAWQGALQRHHGPSVAAKAYVRLRQILSQAVDDDLIPKNPCKVPRGGVEHHAEQRFLSLVELYRLAAAVDLRYRAMVLTAGLAGIRLGELSALRRKDLNLEEGTISVRRKRLRLASGEIIEDAPKSRAGQRTVAIPRALVAELEEHLASIAPGADSYVFTSASGSPLDANNFRHRVWIPATRASGQEGLRFHDLRHTAGTLAARTGATTKELMVRLGHSSASAAMVYQHAAADRDRTIADELEMMIRQARPGTHE